MAAAAVAVVGCLAACEQVAAQAYDPPTKFASKGRQLGVSLDASTGEVSALLSDKLLYVAAEGELRAVDVTSGRLVWSSSSRWEGAARNGDRPPVRLSSGGRWLVLTAFSNSVEGSGTAQSHLECDVVAVDAHTGKKVWQETLKLPSDTEGTEVQQPALVGADSEVAILGYGARTYAIDVRKHELTWKRDNLTAGALAGGVLTAARKRSASASSSYLVGVDATSGKTRWNGPTRWLHPDISPAGPGLVSVAGRDYGEGGNLGMLVRATTGRAVDRTQLGDSVAGAEQNCVYDDKSVTVCSAYRESSGRVLTAFDAGSGKQLWRLGTTSGRRAPLLGTAFHGVVYGELRNDDGETERRVLLDARTGKDKKGDPGLYPALVSRFGALDVTSGSGATVHRATG